jgi:hypothetical protein
MKLTMLLADAVQAVNGKLYVLGGGWSITGPEPAPSALAIKIDVPWDEANKKHRFKLALVNEDGRAVMVPGTQAPVEVAGEFEAGRPAGLRPGTPLDVVLAINVGPLLLEPGSRYVWRCWVDEETREDWEVGFSTRPKAR